jgi:hypothetical protein
MASATNTTIATITPVRGDFAMARWYGARADGSLNGSFSRRSGPAAL